MLTLETLSLIIGYIGTAVGIIAYQIKSRKVLLIFQIIGNFLPALSFVLLGMDKLVGGLVGFVAAVHTFVAYRAVSKGTTPSNGVSALFVGLYGVTSLIPALISRSTTTLVLAIFPFLCGFFFVLALRAKSFPVARVFYWLGSVPWLFYDCLGETVAVANLVTHTIALLSVTLGIVRYDIWPKLKASRKEEKS